MSAPPAWVNDYVGLPFAERGRERAGCDCWGLVRLVLAERFGVTVPSYVDGYESIKDHGRLAALIEQGISTTEARRHGEGVVCARAAPEASPCHRASVVTLGWLAVASGAEQAGDVILLRMSGLPIHVGILVAPGWMLHTREATGSVLERFAGLAWGRRVLGVFRHAAL